MNRRRRHPIGARPHDHGGEAGFTLIETVVSIGLIGIVMASLTSFFVHTTAMTRLQRGTQTATQQVQDAIEQVRSLSSSEVIGGRDEASVTSQWANPAPGVQPYLLGMQMAWDTDPAVHAGDGAHAALPTTAHPVRLGGVDYSDNYYVGACWQVSAGGVCSDDEYRPNVFKFYKIVVAVTWTDQQCAPNPCSFVSATLVSAAPVDPVFRPSVGGVAPPTVTNPGNQTGVQGTAEALQLAATSGATPLSWTGSGLPPGLSVSSSGLVTGTPTTVGTFSVLVTATDPFGEADSGSFTWTISAAPLIVATPADQTSDVNRAIPTLQLTATGGTAPYTGWSASGLPPGLAINAAGRITGTPTVVGTYPNVVATVTDTLHGTASSTAFSWTVVNQPTITVPAAGPTSDPSGPITLQASASDGTGPFAWSATGLPTGLTISAAGLVSGTASTPGSYPTVVTVTDAAGATTNVSLTWTIT